MAVVVVAVVVVFFIVNYGDGIVDNVGIVVDYAITDIDVVFNVVCTQQTIHQFMWYNILYI